MPPFAPSSSGRSSRYRRRIVPPLSSSPDHSQSSYSNSAVAAAELAASSIAISSGDNNTINTTNAGSTTLPRPSVLQNLRASRARLMQRNSHQYREQRFFKIKLICFGVIFVVGLVVIGKRGGDSHYNGHYLTEDQRNLNHYKDNKQSSNNKSKQNDSGNNVKLSVPPPPSRGQNNQHNNLHKKHSENRSPPKIQMMNSDSSSNQNQNEAAAPLDKSPSNNKGIKIQQTIPHVIPPILTFTYHTNLLTTPQSDLSDSEDRALSHNVQQITSLHPESTVHFLNNDDCLTSIIDTLGPDTNLTNYFTQETHGMYKADICRGAALYQTGGLYFDIDVETRGIPLWNVIAPMTEFVTVLVHEDSNHLGGFFQAFIGVVPRHPVMKRYLELFVEYYEGRVKVDGPLGVYLLRMAYDEVISKDDQESKTELWQEIRYSPKKFPEVTRSRWGKRRACQMMVVAPPMVKERDAKFGFERKERVIPIFSHANGSRMCGGKDTNRNGNSDTA